MTGLDLCFEDGAVPEMLGAVVHEYVGNPKVVGLSGGMQSGAPSVSIIFKLADGSYVHGQVSLKLFLTAADALKARYGDLR